MKSLANASRIPGVPAVRRCPSHPSGMRMTIWASWWQSATQVCPKVGGGVQPRMNGVPSFARSEEHTSELQSLRHLVCRLLLEKKNKTRQVHICHNEQTNIR